MTIKLHAPLNVSSHVKALGFDEATGTLAVQFHKGEKVYHYHGVPKQSYLRMHAHESPGGFFTKNVRDLFKCTPQR